MLSPATLVTPSGRELLVEPLPRSPATDAQVRALLVVPRDEPRERTSALLGAGEDLEVEALGEDGPDPALASAVRLGPIRPGAAVLQAEQPDGAPEGPGHVRAAVVGEEAPDPDTLVPEPAHGADEEPGRRPALLVGQELRVHQPGRVVERDVEHLPAGAPPVIASIAGRPVPRAVDD